MSVVNKQNEKGTGKTWQWACDILIQKNTEACDQVCILPAKVAFKIGDIVHAHIHTFWFIYQKGKTHYSKIRELTI